MARITLEMPLNRVEGDLDVQLTIENGQVVEAKSIGTLYRGFENMLSGRDPLDALVITPRICGICSITHLTAAVKALEDAQSITPPAQAVRLRNLSIMAETVQSDLRQVFLMYLPDFAHAYYANRDFYEEAVRWYAPLKGEGSIEALRATKDILKVIAIIGGQWPHTSHMVPGGICTIPSVVDLALAQTHIFNVKAWYARAVLGVETLETFLEEVQSATAFDSWIEAHPDTHLARFVRLNRAVALDRLGASYDGFISFGAIDNPQNPSQTLRSAGVLQRGERQTLSVESICEDVSHSWYEEAVGTCQPPAKGETSPQVNKA
ncbi:nickel-dependent hydrogenase large subunit, partial [Alcanivorax sp.]|uniref:nickel-dependent hydrogenase large subunit n=1 Tax=Alcanivorax sp. TaxID=1872427 RepID=UPI00258EEAD9